MWDTWLEDAKPLIPVIVIDDLEQAVPMANALVQGGVKLLEVTLRTELGLQAIEAISKEVPDAIVGVGTVTNSRDFEGALKAGAQFVVSPGISQELLGCASEWGGAYLPGVATPSEAMMAREAGLTRMKFFPAAAAGGIPMLSALAGPFKDILFCPTGGVSQANKNDYLGLSNVFAVGGSWLTPKDAMAARNWQKIQDLASNS